MPKAAAKNLPEAPKPLAKELSTEQAAELAESLGLKRINRRPPMGEYLREIWQRKAFIAVHASSIAYSKNRDSYLGQLWSVLTPTLNAAMYVIIFGVMLGTNRGLQNVIAFITVGTFMFRFFNKSVTSGGKSIQSNANLVRSLKFPRAILPISTVFTELVMFIPTTAVMLLFCFVAGHWPGQGSVPVRWSWFLIIPIVLIFWVFNTGCGLLLARIEAKNPDIANVVPSIMRIFMYLSGVIFSISHYVHNGVADAILQHQPIAVYLYLARMVLINERSIPYDPMMWWWGIGWALLAILVGFVMFWRKEESYGRA